MFIIKKILFHCNKIAVKSVISRKMHEKYVVINKVPTHIMSWGKSLDDEWSEAGISEKPDSKKEAIICVTGNPGLPGFYTGFLSTLHIELEKRIPIFCIGQSGHDDPPEEHPLLKLVPKLKKNHDLYNLQGQINHKVEFIRTYFPEDVKIHLIGHSVGSWEILELLKVPDISKRISKCYLLFPTIERMVESKNGVLLYHWIDPVFFILRFFYRLFDIFPYYVKIMLVSLYFWATDMPNYFMGTTLKYLKPCVIDNIWFLALDEMKKIRELDEEIVRKNVDRLKLYYGTSDGWVPTNYYKELKDRFPEIDAELDASGMEHAFVLKSGPQMARLIVDWMNEDKKKSR